MKDTGTPAYRPTKDCIWNSFRSSGKRHLILTGDRGSGKSTLLRELTGFPAVLGITTWAEPGKAVYLRDNMTGETVKTGWFDASLPGTANRMRPLTEGFRGLGVEALARFAEAEGAWVTIDEIGYLESDCPEYCAAIRSLMEIKRVAAVVRNQKLPFLDELRRRPDVFCVDLDRPFGRMGCVIMASGLGMRFGGNKLLEELGGKTLIERALDATEGIFDCRVVVTRQKAIEELCSARDIPVLLHSLPYRSDTVRLGLEAVMGKNSEGPDHGRQTDGCLFCPADQPLLRRQTVASLALCAAAAKTGGGQEFIWRTAFGERAGSPVLFPSWAYGELLTLPEGKGGGFVIRKHPDQVRLTEAKDEWELEDVDRPVDLERLRRRQP